MPGAHVAAGESDRGEMRTNENFNVVFLSFYSKRNPAGPPNDFRCIYNLLFEMLISYYSLNAGTFCQERVIPNLNNKASAPSELIHTGALGIAEKAWV